jgi:hypothetical protein
VPEDPRDNGDYFSGGGFLAKVGNFVHRADEMSGRGVHSLVSGLERTGQAAANAVGLDSIGDYLGTDAGIEEQHAAAPVPGATSWQDVKADPSLSNIGSFVGEQTGGALPWARRRSGRPARLRGIATWRCGARARRQQRR